MRFAGFSVTSLDVKYWHPWKSTHVGKQLPKDIGNPLDMLTDSGMASLS
jgi:hypothetical protein